MLPIIENHRAAIGQLCQKYDVRRLDVFGSAARDAFDPMHSDLDFIVEFNNFTVHHAADRYFGLMLDLEDMFNTKIDLVSYTAIRNPYFKHVVDQTRVQLYAA